MKNRNLILFIAFNTILLLMYSIYTHNNNTHNATLQQKTKHYTNIQNETDISPIVTNDKKNNQNNVSLPLFSINNDTIQLTWNKSTGALLQAMWNDGTKFFPDNLTLNYNDRFSGIGVMLNTKFYGDPTVVHSESSDIVTFSSNNNDKLVYIVPKHGSIIHVEIYSPSKAIFQLIQQPSNLEAVKGLGRVFSISYDDIETVTWDSILKKPYLAFLGFKSKTLPRATRWIGMDAGIPVNKMRQQTHYFAAIWEINKDPQRSIDLNPGYSITPDESHNISARLYLGPKQSNYLATFGNNSLNSENDGSMFKQIINFGFFGLVAKLLFLILDGIHHIIPNWGISIILLTVFIRAVLWPLNNKTTVQMLRMKELEPFQKQIQAKYEKFGNDFTKKAEMQKELMTFYKKNQHNPMGGCLPALLQMPVFFSLWSMLSTVFELRHAHFFGWLVDLSYKDPYYILPILMGISMIIQQILTPTIGDPMQKKMMTILMPIMFSFFFANTPSGLCLYYLAFNIIGIFQTWLVIKTYKPQPVNT